MTKPDRPNGCYNRADFNRQVWVQDGWVQQTKFIAGRNFHTREPKMKLIPDPMTKSCQYSIGYGNDPRCQGCKHNQYENGNNEEKH